MTFFTRNKKYAQTLFPKKKFQKLFFFHDSDRRMATRGSLKYGGQVIGHNMVPAYQLYRFKPHRHRVLNLYKKAWRALESHDADAQFYNPFWVDNSFCFERTVLRARFDENKHVTSLAKATELLKGNVKLNVKFRT